jgi:hypothetical protein
VVVAASLAERDVPDYIEVDHKKMTAKVDAGAGPVRGAYRSRWSEHIGDRVLSR